MQPAWIQLSQWIAQHKLTPVIGHVFPARSRHGSLQAAAGRQELRQSGAEDIAPLAGLLLCAIENAIW